MERYVSVLYQTRGRVYWYRSLRKTEFPEH